MTTATTLVIERILDAPPERVFAVWTTAEAMTRWYRDGDDFTVVVRELDVRVGGRYRSRVRAAQASHPASSPASTSKSTAPHRLVMTETLDGVARTVVRHPGDGGAPRNRRRAQDAGSVLTHERFPTEQHRDLAAGGWPSFIDRIEALATA